LTYAAPASSTSRHPASLQGECHAGRSPLLSAPLPNPEWLGKLSEEILEPELPIVDPHHHIWDHPGSRYLLDELLADVNSGHNIVATVFIQCGSGYRTTGPEEMRPIGESEFVRAIAEEADRRGTKTKICAGIVSFADLRLPNVDAVLEAQIEAAGGRFRGIRQIPAHDPAIVGASSICRRRT
jgi:L-fuconolactonase